MMFLKHISFRFTAQYLFYIAIAGVCLLCTDAYAAGTTLAQCAQNGGFPPTALTGPIVYCVQTTIQGAVVGALANLSTYFKGTTFAVMTLAIVMHGAHMVSGERGLNAKSMVLLVKIAFVAVFSMNLGGWANNVFAIMNEVVSDVVPGSALVPNPTSQPWAMIDSIMGTLFGFAPGILIFQGLLWLVTALTSGTASAGMAFALIIAFIELILFVIEIIYTFLTAYIVVAFMLILSPMFVPMIIFQVSEHYFRKWLEVIIGAMLIPVMIFAALSFSLILYTTLICNIFTLMLPSYNCQVPLNPNNPPNFSSFWQMNQSIWSLTLGVDPNVTNALNNVLRGAPGDSRDVPSALTTINPFNRGGFNMNTLRPPGVNFGNANSTIAGRVMFALISLWLYTMILKQLIEKMPHIAQEIAGVSIGISLKAPKLKDKINEIKSDAAGGAATSIGALAGGQLGRVTGNARVAQVGAIGGGILGHVLARRFTG